MQNFSAFLSAYPELARAIIFPTNCVPASTNVPTNVLTDVPNGEKSVPDSTTPKEEAHPGLKIFSLLLNGYPELAKMVMLFVRKPRHFFDLLLSCKRVCNLFSEEEIHDHVVKSLDLELVKKETGSVAIHYVRKGTKVKHGRYLKDTSLKSKKVLKFYRNGKTYHKKVWIRGILVLDSDKTKMTKKKWDEEYGNMLFCSSPIKKKVWINNGGTLAYFRNRATGETQEFDSYGRKKREGFVKKEHGIKSFTGKEWYYGKKEITKRTLKDSKIVAEKIYLYRDRPHFCSKKGQITMESVTEGRFFHVKKYRKDGALKKTFQLIKSEKTGKCVTYFKNGQIKKEESFLKGRLDGPYVFYYPNGKKESEGVMKDENLVGKKIKYTPSGGLKKVGRYLDGVQCGKGKKWGRDGQLKWKRIYRPEDTYCFSGSKIVGVKSRKIKCRKPSKEEAAKTYQILDEYMSRERKKRENEENEDEENGDEDNGDEDSEGNEDSEEDGEVGLDQIMEGYVRREKKKRESEEDSEEGSDEDSDDEDSISTMMDKTIEENEEEWEDGWKDKWKDDEGYEEYKNMVVNAMIDESKREEQDRKTRRGY